MHNFRGADDFPLVGTVNQQLSGFGDGVCVPVIRYIDENILTPTFDLLNSKRRKSHAR